MEPTKTTDKPKQKRIISRRKLTPEQMLKELRLAYERGDVDNDHLCDVCRKAELLGYADLVAQVCHV